MGKLPDSFVSEYKGYAAGAKVFGVPIEELDLEELLATIGSMFAAPRIEPNETLMRLAGNKTGVRLELPNHQSPPPAIRWDNCRKCNEPHHLKRNGLCLCCDALVNPYQTSFPDEFLDDTVQGYEESLRTHQGIINGLRDRVRELEAENEALKRQFMSPMLVMMESADID